MVIKQSKSDKIFDVVNYIILGIMVVIVLYPLLFVLNASFSSPLAVVNGEVGLLPKGFTLEAYQRTLKNTDILRSYMNNILYTVVGTSINIILTVMGAYPLSRRDLYGRKTLMMLFTFTMYFGGGMIPTFLIVKSLGLLDTMWALILPHAVGTWNLIVMKTYFQSSIPEELYEAADIDGSSCFVTLIKIVLPLSMPIIAVQLLFYSVGHWNAYMGPLIYMQTYEKYPLQIILRQILLQNQMGDMVDVATEAIADQVLIAETLKYATIVVSSLPVLCIYPYIQKYFTKGVMMGAIKG